MKNWNELTHSAGFDWAGDHHDVVIVDRAGEVVTHSAPDEDKVERTPF